MNKISKAGLCAASLLALAGCNRDAPSGQVAATVDGQEVTLQEINAELQSANVSAGGDKQALQRQALQRVIDRKLLLKAAEDKGIDRTPDFLAEKRRADEMMLAQAYAKQQLNAVPVPSEAEISKFMADRPTLFANREQLALDQIRFAPPKDLKSLNVLDRDKSMEAVATHLRALGIKFERVPAGLDTGAVPPQMMQAINRLSPTEPFVIPSQGLITVSVITDRKPVAIDQAEARSAAVRAWRQEKFGDLLQQQLTALRGNAKISYQNGFGPPPATPGNGAGAPAAAPAPAAN